MYKMVIIDDEPLIVRGLQNIIHWDAYGFADIRTFSNVLQARASIFDNVPDVVITDIRMPGISGLELLKQCREAGLKTVFVLVSAFSEFEYAKQGLENGAFSYILKPLNRETMDALAEKLCTALSAQRRSELEKQVRTLVLQALTTGTIPDPNPLLHSKYLCTPYRVCITNNCPPSGGPWYRIYGDLSIGILPSDVEAVTVLPALAGFSQAADSSDELHRRIWEALTTFYTLRFYGVERGMLFAKAELDMQNRRLDEIIHGIREQKAQRTLFLLQQLKDDAKEQLIPIDSMTYMYNTLISVLSQTNAPLSLGEDIRPFGSCLSMYGVLPNIDIMFESLFTFAENLGGQEEDAQSSKAAVKAAIQFVDENYTKIITLEQLSKRFHVSLSYLSRQFKSMTDANFNEYLKSKRIGYACELLSTTSLSIYDVGSLSGYADYFYFNKAFKKVTGLTPAKYREKETGGA